MNLFLTAILLFGALPSLAQQQKVGDVRCPEAPTSIVVEQGSFAYRPGINFQLSRFAATMVSIGKTLPMCLAKRTVVQHGDVQVRGEALSRLFNQKLQQSGERKITDLKIEMKGNEVLLSGKVKKLVGIPFSVQGPVNAEGGRTLKLYARKVSAIGIPMKGLLEMLGMELGNMVGASSAKGIVTREDSILFDPAELANITGHIERARIANNALHVRFAKDPQKGAVQDKSRPAVSSE